MAAIHTYTYKVVDEGELQLDVYGEPDGSLCSGVVTIHGGALIMGNRKMIGADVPVVCEPRDYRIISIGYRLAPETKLPAIIDDVRDAFRWIRGEGAHLCGIDPDRLAVTGGSAGGYLTLMAGFCLDFRPRALISFSGYGDIIGPWFSRPDPFYCQQPLVPQEEAYRPVWRKRMLPGAWPEDGNRWHFYLYCRQHGLWPSEVVGYNPDVEPDLFTPYCPLQHVTPDYPPTLLVHGDQDTDVPFEQSVRMDAALTKAGVEHEFLAIPGAPHGVERGMTEKATAELYGQVRTFLEQRL